ncbi:TRAP transporter substrate-binding protein [Aminobacter sp. AP02]|uniref:TRAP transporter substrate-binding protein n=1 Tax=Aminobacter sp. AP02 TaxID=2135737 RepID=UPI000D6D117D|nr:TRAP transporter substrate-binding protein [Aminobacter sp. AP02]PWK76707.1 tripartite ATP-independent transporter DctP family solute receptor [Aminobacter sp. AP02]
MRLKTLALTLAAAAGLASLVAPATAARLGHGMPAEHPQAVAMKKFAEDVAKATENRVEIQVFDGGILGGDDKMLQATQSGTLELYVGGVAPLSGKIKEVQIFDFPFMFANREEASAVLNGPVGRKMLDRMSEIGLTGLAWSEFGFRNLTNSVKPIKSVDDISGLKLRVMQNPVALDTWKTLGANAVTMSFSEVFSALETKALDGQENPLAHIYANRIYEVQKYITLTNHVYSPVAIVASKTWFDALPEADRNAVMTAAADASAYQAKLIAENDGKITDQLKETGIEIDTMPEAELAKMREMVKPVVEKYTASVGADFVQEFTVAIEAARKAAN